MRKIKIRKRTMAEAAAHTPSRQAKETMLRSGGGVHRTASRDRKHLRRQERIACRQQEA